MSDFTDKDRKDAAEKALRDYKNEPESFRKKSFLRALFDRDGDYAINKNEISKTIAEAEKMIEDRTKIAEKEWKDALNDNKLKKEIADAVGKARNEATLNSKDIAYLKKTYPGVTSDDPKKFNATKPERRIAFLKDKNRLLGKAQQEAGEQAEKLILERVQGEVLERIDKKLYEKFEATNIPDEAITEAHGLIVSEIRSAAFQNKREDESKELTKKADKSSKPEPLTAEEKQALGEAKKIAQQQKRDNSSIEKVASKLPGLLDRDNDIREIPRDDRIKAVEAIFRQLGIEVTAVEKPETSQQTPSNNLPNQSKGR